MYGSPIINIFVYTHNDYSPVTSQIGLKPNIFDSPQILLMV